MTHCRIISSEGEGRKYNIDFRRMRFKNILSTTGGRMTLLVLVGGGVLMDDLKCLNDCQFLYLAHNG